MLTSAILLSLRKMQSLAVGAIALVGFATMPAPAPAAIIGNNVNIDFLGGLTTFSLAPGASYTLYGNNGDIFNPVDVSTTGSALVNSLGAPFYSPPRPTSYFTDRGTVSIGPGMMFTAFPLQTNIAFSLNDTFIGLAFSGDDGTHYGFARFDGTTLLSYGYETIAGQSIIAGAPFTAPISVPEPASIALLALGLAGLGAVRRRRN